MTDGSPETRRRVFNTFRTSPVNLCRPAFTVLEMSVGPGAHPDGLVRLPRCRFGCQGGCHYGVSDTCVILLAPSAEQPVAAAL